MPLPAFHRPPRHPHVWLGFFIASQLAVAWMWWQLGWKVGITSLLASHAAFCWGVFVPQSRMFGPALTRLPLDRDDRRVWLTIDDGPSPQTQGLLDLLDAHGAKATFFLVGERAQAMPDAVREIVRRGHGIANHSASHPEKWFWALGPRRMRDEIARTQQILQDITGTAPHWFRAVVGMSNPFVSAPLRAHGLARVAWNARGFDGAGVAPERVVARIEQKLSPGAIVLLHEGGAATRSLDAMQLLLEALQRRGYGTVLPERM